MRAEQRKKMELLIVTRLLLLLPLLITTFSQTVAGLNLQQLQQQKPHWNIFGSNQQLPTFQLRPFQNIRSIIQNIENGDSSEEAPPPADAAAARPPAPNNNEAQDHLPPPWRHHIDFDEKHPGEDLIAVESIIDKDDGNPIFRVPQPSSTTSASSRIRAKNEAIEERRKLERTLSSRGGSNDYPDYHSVFPDFSPPALSSGSTDQFDSLLESLMDGFRKTYGKPWWKTDNVCVKREEEDGLTPDEDEALTNLHDDDDENETAASDADADDGIDFPRFHMKFSSCEEKDALHTCTTHVLGPNINKTIKTDYECCAGYLLNAKKQICERGTLKSIGPTLHEIGAKEFSRLIKLVGLDAKLQHENLTLFVPTDDSIAEYMRTNRDIDSNEITIAFDQSDEMMRRRRRNVFMPTEELHPVNLRRQQLPEQSIDADWRSNALSRHEQVNNGRQQQQSRSSTSSRSSSSRTRTASNFNSNNNDVSYSHNENNLQQLLLNHMVAGKLSTNDFVDEKILYSEAGPNNNHNRNSVLRLNTWNVNGEKVNTLNCVRLVSVNHRCTNGVIHMVNGMISPVTRTIADVVSSEPELTTLKSFVSVSGHLSTLRDPNAHFTLFAPTNNAIAKLGPAMLTKLRNGDPCLKRIMRNHILPITLCTSIITQKGTIRNLNHEVMSMERTADDKLFVNGTQIITRDIVTTNGIVHVIDTVLTTAMDQPMMTALERAGFTSFVDKMSQVGLKDMLNNMHNITVFAPSNTAMESLPREVLANSTRLRDILLYHIATPETRACHFSHDELLSTKLNQRSIRINIYSMFGLGTKPVGMEGEVTAQCGVLKTVNQPACNGLIHTVDRVLIPSDLNLVETLRTQADFTIFTRLLQESELVHTLRGEVPFTVFVPTDSAFYKLPRDKLEKILNNTDESLKVLKTYIVKDTICCAGISPDIWFMTKRVHTLSGVHLQVYRNTKGQVMFGTSHVNVCDLTASNGVVHAIDTLIETNTESLHNPFEYMKSCIVSDMPF